MAKQSASTANSGTPVNKKERKTETAIWSAMDEQILVDTLHAIWTSGDLPQGREWSTGQVSVPRMILPARFVWGKAKISLDLEFFRDEGGSFVTKLNKNSKVEATTSEYADPASLGVQSLLLGAGFFLSHWEVYIAEETHLGFFLSQQQGLVKQVLLVFVVLIDSFLEESDHFLRRELRPCSVIMLPVVPDRIKEHFVEHPCSPSNLSKVPLFSHGDRVPSPSQAQKSTDGMVQSPTRQSAAADKRIENVYDVEWES
ncbi:hypothetical protein BT69DRAFT_1297322 [Atractiella rhizophila]|nr:hypothetical protein BT69DRAFT_1297322 [Atractiella rhizophila]